MIVVEVKDNGIGMNFEETKKIFEPFFQGSSQKKYNPNGLGVGLYISKKICESLEGFIKVQSEPGEGSTFTFAMKV